jgi:glycosyltransferase involved in cell wall biosynthesis
MPKPRLCLVFPHVVLGGGETATLEVAEGLRGEVDLDVCALDPVETGDVATIREELVARFGAAAFLRQRWQLRPRLRAADVVLWYGVSNAVPKVLAAMADRGARPGSIRVVHTDRAVDGPGFARRWRRVIDAVVCVSPAVARQIPGACFIPNTCSPAHLAGPREEPFAGSGRKTLGWMGRLVPLKNVPWLIDHVEEIGCDLLLQALDTPLLTAVDLMRRAEERGVAERVRFLPPGRDVGTLLRSVDALVVASRHEGFPRVVVEAGRLGVPVISTRVGALPELFAGEILFVDSVEGEPDAASLRRALAAAGPEWGERLRAKVDRLCDRDAVVSQYLDVIERVARERQRHAA